MPPPPRNFAEDAIKQLLGELLDETKAVNTRLGTLEAEIPLARELAERGRTVEQLVGRHENQIGIHLSLNHHPATETALKDQQAQINDLRQSVLVMVGVAQNMSNFKRWMVAMTVPVVCAMLASGVALYIAAVLHK